MVADAVFPAASNAEAISATAPLATVVESQLNWYGAVVLVPTSVVLARNSTRVTPTLSAVLAVTATTPDTVLPAAGEVIETVGGVVSLGVLRTVTLIVAVPEQVSLGGDSVDNPSPTWNQVTETIPSGSNLVAGCSGPASASRRVVGSVTLEILVHEKIFPGGIVL